MSYILKFFLYRNIRIARDRAWDQIIASRGYTGDFWGPYVEEWDVPPKPNMKAGWLTWAMTSTLGRMAVKGVFPYTASNPYV